MLLSNLTDIKRGPTSTTSTLDRRPAWRGICAAGRVCAVEVPLTGSIRAWFSSRESEFEFDLGLGYLRYDR